MRLRWMTLAGVGVTAFLGVGLLLRRNPAEALPAPAARKPVDVFPSLEALGYATRTGNEVRLYQNGEIFDLLADEISKAQHSVHILVFIWRACPASNQVTRAVLERARAGVRCKIVVDPLASPGFDKDIKPQLEEAGCEVQEYKDLAQSISEGEEGIERTHRKIVVIDGRVGITGGFGIWKAWEGDGRAKDEWRDTNARVRGPVVADMQAAFEETWVGGGGEPLGQEDYPPLPRAGDRRAMFVASNAKRGERDPAKQTTGEKMAEILIQSATRRLWIANSYFVPTDRMLQLLVDKARRGVEVKILVPGPVHDWKTVRNAQRASYRKLIRAGIDIYEYQPSMMHAKTWLVDDRLVSVGSLNLDPLSLKQLEEGQLIVDDPELAKRYRAAFLEDLEHAKHKRRAWPGPIEVMARGLLWTIGRL